MQDSVRGRVAKSRRVTAIPQTTRLFVTARQNPLVQLLLPSYGQPLGRSAKYLIRNLAMDISRISWWVNAKTTQFVEEYILKPELRTEWQSL